MFHLLLFIIFSLRYRITYRGEELTKLLQTPHLFIAQLNTQIDPILIYLFILRHGKCKSFLVHKVFRFSWLEKIWRLIGGGFLPPTSLNRESRVQERKHKKLKELIELQKSKNLLLFSHENIPSSLFDFPRHSWALSMVEKIEKPIYLVKIDIKLNLTG